MSRSRKGEDDKAWCQIATVLEPGLRPGRGNAASRAGPVGPDGGASERNLLPAAAEGAPLGVGL